MGFGNCAREEDKHLRVQFLWHGRPHVATLADQVCGSLFERVESRLVYALATSSVVWALPAATGHQQSQVQQAGLHSL